ncbi:MAG: tripartite tricarboxylate transporter substrate-binding protein [Betaproteobacteria bacterium]
MRPAASIAGCRPRSQGCKKSGGSTPDGHTLLFISSAFAANGSLYKLPYDPVRASVPVAMIAAGPNVLVVSPNVPVGHRA